MTREISLYILEILLFIAIVIADAYGLVPITQTLFLLPLVWLVLKLHREQWSMIGFKKPDRLGQSIAIGVGVGVLMELLGAYLTTPWISSWFGVEPDYTGLGGIRGNVTMLIVFLLLSWTLAAFGEEICFRGFLMQRLARVFGDNRAAWIISLVLSSILFGWGHTEQGVSGWIQEGLNALMLGALFLMAKRNLTVPIVAHGVSNTLAFVLIYFGRYPGIY